jgi:flagellar basal-body rod protein FlgG
MIKGMYSSSNGMPPMLVRMEVIANNLANANTTGFKKDNMFVEMLNDPGVAPHVRAGELTTRLNVERAVNFTSGALNQTSNPLDLALESDGWFVVETKRGERYTRNGNFTLSLDGTLTTREGLPVLGADGPIRFPEPHKAVLEGISITSLGVVSVGNKEIGKLRVVLISDEQQLRKAGDSLFRLPNDADVTINDNELPVIRQGFLEESNVDGIEEMIQMIEITRHFESNQKAIASQDASLDKSFEVGRF